MAPSCLSEPSTWLLRTSGTGSDLPPQPLLLLLTLTLNLLTTLKAPADLPASVPPPCCPSAWQASPRSSPADKISRTLRGASSVAPSFTKLPLTSPLFCAPAALGSFLALLARVFALFGVICPRVSSPLLGCGPSRAATVSSSPFSFVPLTGLSALLKALSNVCEMHLKGAGLQRTRASGVQRSSEQAPGLSGGERLHQGGDLEREVLG